MVFVPLKLLMLLLIVAAMAGLIYFVVRRRWGRALLLGGMGVALLFIGVAGLRVAHSPRVHVVEHNTYPSGIHDYVLQQQMAIQEHVVRQQEAVRAHVERQRHIVEQAQREAQEMHDRAIRQVRDCQQHVQTEFVDRVNEGGQPAESQGSREIVEMEPGRMRVESEDGIIEMSPGQMRAESDDGVVEMSPGRMPVQGPDWDEAHDSVWGDHVRERYDDLFPAAQTVYHRAYTGSWAYQGALLTAMLFLITVVYLFLKGISLRLTCRKG